MRCRQGSRDPHCVSAERAGSPQRTANALAACVSLPGHTTPANQQRADVVEAPNGCVQRDMHAYVGISLTAPIENYALIGNAHTGALVGPDGSIDWLCAPRFDAPACFAALLGGDENGCWRIGPTQPVRRTQR